MSCGFHTVKGSFENVIIIERSKFICSIKGIDNESEAKEFVDLIRKKHSLATHNCYAYIADDNGLIQKFSDDGEPQGTAGLPMLEVLKNKRMYKTVAVVTRYFGGIKLGTGGLTRAYGGSVSEALEKAVIANMQIASVYRIITDYERYSKLLKLLSNDYISILGTEFENLIKVEFALKKANEEDFLIKLTDTFGGKIIPAKLGDGYYDFR